MLSARPDLLIGTIIGGKYQVSSLVGEGGMSIVYKAIQEGINRPVAIKLLRDELCDDEANVKRFKRESKAVSQLSHPNLVGIYDVGVADTGQPYMVMEFLEGTSLIDVIDKTGPIYVPRAIPIFIQICDVMNYAHSKGFIHRDLKPHNIMLVKAGEKPDFVKLVDFGIVAVDQNMQAVSQKLTAAGEICGSPLYMSPEQVLDTGVDGRSDIYSLGVMMYEALAGRPPFGGKRITDVMQKHIHSAPPPFSEVCPEAQVPPEVEGVIFKALEKTPDARYQTMDQLKTALLRVTGRADSRPGSASFPMKNPTREVPKPSVPMDVPPPSATPAAAKSAAKTGMVTMLVAMAVGAALAAGAVYFFVVAPHANPPSTEPQVKVEAPPTSPPTATPIKPEKTEVTIEKPVTPPVSTPVTKPRSAGGKRKSRESLSDELNAIEKANLRERSDEYAQ
jgi:serine/threonine-protein kinase